MAVLGVDVGGTFTDAVIDYVRGAYPDCRFEVLYPVDVNDTPFNRAVNFPMAHWTPAVLDNLNIHSAPDVLLFSLLHPRWEFVFQPKYAAYLNLIELWWKVLRSLALKGRRFETLANETALWAAASLRIADAAGVRFHFTKTAV